MRQVSQFFLLHAYSLAFLVPVSWFSLSIIHLLFSIQNFVATVFSLILFVPSVAFRKGGMKGCVVTTLWSRVIFPKEADVLCAQKPQLPSSGSNCATVCSFLLPTRRPQDISI